MCVAEVLTRVFDVFVSSVKRRSSPKPSVRLRTSTKTRSLPAINTFACNVISYWEVNSRGYVVASDKRICLLCDTVFRGE